LFSDTILSGLEIQYSLV